MIILAFESTAGTASVALCDGERMLAQYTVNNGMTHSELLLPMAEDMLRALGLGFEQIELYAVSVGPGSFTGVRIGASLVKGLAFGKNTPCVGVSSLEAMAKALEGIDGIIVPCMDARRSQAYTAIFRSSKDGIVRLTDDDAMGYKDIAARLKEYNEPIYLTGDGYERAYGALVSEGITPCSTPRLLQGQNAYAVAMLALEAYERGEFTTDSKLSPIYLRMPQAERERLERIKNENK